MTAATGSVDGPRVLIGNLQERADGCTRPGCPPDGSMPPSFHRRNIYRAAGRDNPGSLPTRCRGNVTGEVRERLRPTLRRHTPWPTQRPIVRRTRWRRTTRPLSAGSALDWRRRSPAWFRASRWRSASRRVRCCRCRTCPAMLPSPRRPSAAGCHRGSTT